MAVRITARGDFFLKCIDLGIPLVCSELEEYLQSNLPRNDKEFIAFRDSARSISQRLKVCKQKAWRNEHLEPGEMLSYFRSLERYQIIGRILDYLECFLDGLPDERTTIREPMNPFNQFKEFTASLIAELEDRDVRSAVLSDLEAMGRIDNSTREYYCGRIDFMVRKLRERLESASKPLIGHWKILFSVLCDFCRFWFSIRDGDPSRIRKADAAIYQLATLLMEKIDLQGTPPPAR